MDFASYKVDLPYPSRDAFKTKYWYSAGKVMAQQLPGGTVDVLVQGADLTKCVTEVVVNEPAFRAARDAYNRADHAVYERFKADLFEDLGITDHPKREKLFSMAWDEGHSAGYSEVYSVADRLVDLIKD